MRLFSSQAGTYAHLFYRSSNRLDEVNALEKH